MATAPEKFENGMESKWWEDWKSDPRHVAEAHEHSSAAQALSQAPVGATEDFQWAKESGVGNGASGRVIWPLETSESFISGRGLILEMESNWSAMYHKHNFLYHLFQPFWVSLFPYMQNSCLWNTLKFHIHPLKTICKPHFFSSV